MSETEVQTKYYYISIEKNFKINEVFIVRNMVKKENLDVWPLSNWELVSHFFIFRPIADAICHTLFYERRWF